MNKITSVEDDQRKILMKKFWSLGTILGSMGSLSQKALPEIFLKMVFLHPWDPNEAPVNPICPSHAKNLDLFPTCCDPYSIMHAFIIEVTTSSAIGIDCTIQAFALYIYLHCLPRNYNTRTHLSRRTCV